MKKMVIKLDDDGFVYRGTKLIAVVNDGDIMFKHYSYKKHREEIEYLMGDRSSEPDEFAVDIGLEPIDPKPKTPAHLLLEGEGRWYGESNPPVVEWRKKNWSKEAFDEKYGNQTDHLKEVYEKHNLIYDRNNNTNG